MAHADMNFDNLECPICKGLQEKKLFHDKVWGGEDGDVFVWCCHCDVVFLCPFPDKEKVDEFYSNEFGTYMVERSGEMEWDNIEQQYLNLSKRELPLRSPVLDEYLVHGSVLEVGSSTGFVLDYLVGKGLDCHGVEPSKKHADFARSRGNQIFEDFSSVSQKYNNIIHFYVLEHVLDPKIFLNLCLDQVKPGGRMIFEVPHREDALLSLYELSGYRDFILQKMHIFYHSVTSLKYVLDSLSLIYKIIPGQRYGLKNHLSWVIKETSTSAKDVGFLSEEVESEYKKNLIESSYFDYFTVVVDVA